MTEERFNHIKAMPGVRDSIILKLEHIRRYLNMGKASVMVGAGFSKNAKKSHSVDVKDWDGLTQDFIDRLYSKEEKETQSFKFVSPLRFASQIEASFGRHELEDIIKAAVPDDSLTPGPLHEQLVSLDWRDIFTTNYDTLLERAATSTGMKYEVVTTKETLYYQASKRIIKLHGSHPNARPLIITEEDYRRYPIDFPEFVNTVRQALLETVFCLIGFSGEDPNFLQWLGWIRDIMGDRMSPVYMISVQRSPISDAEKALLKNRGINIIQIPNGLSINEFFDFIFEFLKIKPKENTWTLKLAHQEYYWQRIYSSNTPEQQFQIINDLRKYRTSYPGWLIVKDNKRDDVYDLMHSISHIKDGIENITDPKLQLQFLYEIDWRMRINFGPMFRYDWYVEALSKHVTRENLLNDENFEYSASLAISLFSIHRLRFSVEEAEIIENTILEVVDKLDLEELNRFRYEQCLLRLPLLRYGEIYKILETWNPTAEDYKGVIWKSVILNEISDGSQAASLLINSKQQAQKAMLTKENAELEESAIGMIDSILNILPANRLNNKHYSTLKDNEFSFYKYLQTFVNRIRESIHNNKFRSSTIRREHSFNLQHITNTFSMDGNQNDDELWLASSMFIFWEMYGYPMGFKEYSINTEALSLGIDSLLGSELSPFGYQYLIRSLNSTLIEKSLTRERVCTTPRSFISYIVPTLLKTWKEKYAHTHELSLREWRFKVSILPILSRLSIFSDPDSLSKLVDIYLSLLNSGDRQIKIEALKCIMDSQSLADIRITIGKCLSMALDESINEILYSAPEDLAGECEVSEQAFKIVIEGLASDEEKIANNAYMRCARFYDAYSNYNVTVLNESIVNWRNKYYGKLPNTIYSFNLIPYGATAISENNSIESIINNAFEAFKENKEDYSNKIGHSALATLLDVVTPLTSRLTTEQIDFLFSAICNVLEKQQDTYQSSRIMRSVLFARNSAEYHIGAINKLILSCEIKDISMETLTKLQRVLTVYCEMGYPALRSMLKINEITKELSAKKITPIIQNVIINGTESIQADALAYIQHKIDKNVQNVWKFLINAFQFMETQDLSIFVPVLSDLCISQPSHQLNIRYALEGIHRNLSRKSLWRGDEYDIQYHVMKILGFNSELPPSQFNKLAGRWKDDIDHRDTPNDVKRGYFEGKEIYRIQQEESKSQ